MLTKPRGANFKLGLLSKITLMRNPPPISAGTFPLQPDRMGMLVYISLNRFAYLPFTDPFGGIATYSGCHLVDTKVTILVNPGNVTQIHPER